MLNQWVSINNTYRIIKSIATVLNMIDCSGHNIKGQLKDKYCYFLYYKDEGFLGSAARSVHRSSPQFPHITIVMEISFVMYIDVEM